MSCRQAARGTGACVFLFCLIAFLFGSPALSGQESLGRGRITGTVEDENGNPVEGAKIVVQSVRYQSVLEGVSDKKGRFAVAGMGTGLWRVTASKAGYGSSQIDYDVKQLTRNPPIVFTLKKMTGIAALTQDEEMLKRFEEGNTLLNEGRTEEALKIFEDFLAKYPEIYPIRLSIGSCYLKNEEWDKAEKEFSFVLDKIMAAFGDLKRDPATSIRALSGLGEIFLKKNDPDKAMGFFKQAVDISPEDEGAAYNVGEVFFSHQQIDQAIRYFELAVRIKKDWPRPYLRLGYAYLNKGDYAKAIENFTRFVEMDPQNPEVPQIKNIIATVEKLKKELPA